MQLTSTTNTPASTFGNLLYRNYYAMGEVTDFSHHFEVYFVSDFKKTMLVKGNDPRHMYPYPDPCDAIPAGLYLGVSEHGPDYTQVEEEPERFKVLSPIPDVLVPLAEGVINYVQRYFAPISIKIRYEGLMRGMKLYEYIPMHGGYKVVSATGLHYAGSPTIKLNNYQASYGRLDHELESAKSIPFSPIDKIQGLSLFKSFQRKDEFARFSRMVLDILDRKILFPMAVQPKSFKQYCFYEVILQGNTPLFQRISQYDPIMAPILDRGKDHKSVRFEFDVNNALKSSMVKSKEVKKLNLSVIVRLRLKEMALDLSVIGSKDEYRKTFKFRGDLADFEGQKVLASALQVIEEPSEARKTQRDQLIDGERYETITIRPRNTISIRGV